MKYYLLIVLTLSIDFQSIGQEIETVAMTTQQMDEPPTMQGRTLYSITFTKGKYDGLATYSYYENTDKLDLKDSITIERDRIKILEDWRGVNKNVFTLTDLGIDITTLKSRTSSYKLNFEIPEDFIVRVDSFQFCQQYKMTKSISTGGEIVMVTLVYESGQKEEFVFDTNDVGTGDFGLKNYLLCYILLKDKVPNVIRNYDFFTRDRLADILLYYQSTVECEGYYYREYTDKNRGMSNRDRRMMTGWDFVKYMERRTRK